jgi:type I restriction-modification system DNA methylase subunit
MDKNLALEKVKALTEKYLEAVKEGRVAKYNEEMTKKDFILPLFEALGWKTTDSREVTAEEKISKKRVDYGFRINDIPKFFLEAKSFREDLDNRKFIEQAINYSWHKGCTWAILTNFESLKIFNAEVKTEHPWLSQLKPTLHCTEFLAKFEELYLLSRESLENGLLDREAEKWGKKAKKTPINERLLNDFTHFRDILGKNITKLNASKNLTEEELDECVQRLLDRLIFIRNCEDRELEPKTLIANYREWESKGKGHVVKSLRQTFVHFDNEYNSKIFAEHLCDSLDIDNEVLHEVIEGLYTTKENENYDFSIIDADVLGTIYEQYLSHILKKTGKRAKLTENHLHRKEQGIYYTPTYIVDYIVRNTLGEKLKEKTIDVEKIRVIDLACGSGSFLIKAFDVLNEYYKKNDKDYKQTQFSSDSALPFKIKTRILQNNIFGVDLDKQAIEIAQLNLLLKIAEKGHRLPILEKNITMGNSLIDSELVAGSKAFKWEEQFNNIMSEGGFDVVIGNPPYYNIETLPTQEEKDYLKNYEVYAGHSDILYFFYNKGISLLKPNGIFGFITSRYFLEATYAKNLRKYILENCEIIKIIDLSNLPVFKNVGIHTVILILKKQANVSNKNKIFYKDVSSIEQLMTADGAYVKQNELNENAWALGNETSLCLFKKINSLKAKSLGSISTIEQGQKTGLNKAFTVTKEIIEQYNLERKFVKKLVKNSFIEPYFIHDKGLYVIYASDQINSDNAPNILNYLKQFKEQLEAREVCRTSSCKWYRLQRPRRAGPFEAREKIIVPYRAERNMFGYDDQQRYNDGGDVRVIVMNDPAFPTKYVLALLNSKLMNFYYRFIGRKKGNQFEYFVEPLEKIPLVEAPPIDKERLIILVNEMVSVSARLDKIGNKKTDEKIELEEKKAKTEELIDSLVYKIYGINDKEKKIIESSLQ